MMTLSDRVIDCGRRSELNTPRKDFTCCRVHIICTVYIIIRSWMFANNLYGRNCQILGIADGWLRQIMSCWILNHSRYCYYQDVKYDLPTRLSLSSSRRATWNTQLYTCRVLLEDTSSSDVYRVPQRASFIPWRKYFHEHTKQINVRLKSVFRSRTKRNDTERNIEMRTGCCPKSGENLYWIMVNKRR